MYVFMLPKQDVNCTSTDDEQSDYLKRRERRIKENQNFLQLVRKIIAYVLIDKCPEYKHTRVHGFIGGDFCPPPSLFYEGQIQAR